MDYLILILLLILIVVLFWLGRNYATTNTTDLIMKREEFRDKKAKDYRKHREAYGIKDPVYLDEIEEAYYQGMVDADTHPHLISVEDYSKDKLPPLIDKNNPYGESVQVLFVVVLDGVQYINKGTFDYDTGVWHSLDMQCSFCKENVTHWMPMPSVEHLKDK